MSVMSNIDKVIIRSCQYIKIQVTIKVHYSNTYTLKKLSRTVYVYSSVFVTLHKIILNVLTHRNVRKRTFGHVCLSKIQISLRECAGWSESTVGAFRIPRMQSFFMRRTKTLSLRWGKVHFLTLRLIKCCFIYLSILPVLTKSISFWHCDCLFLQLTYILYPKYLVTRGGKSFTLKVEPFLKGDKSNFDRVAAPERAEVPLLCK